MNNDESFTPVILSGGSGMRLWPVSVRQKAKQFHAFSGSKSMLSETAARLDVLGTTARPVIVCGASQEELVRSQVGDRDPLLIFEPAGKNTAPAIAAACLALTSKGDNPVVAVLAADHIITDPEAFSVATQQASDLARQGYLVTFGVVPNKPSTGYGYIKPGAKIDSGYKIDRFEEKPDAITAGEYVEAGYFWNSGIFMFRAKDFLRDLRRWRPDIADTTKAALSMSDDNVSIDAAAWEAVPSESIDYAVMEHTEHGAVVALDAGWNDLGSWRTLLDIGTSDSEGNVAHDEHVLFDTSSTFIRATKPVVTIGVQDLIIVETEKAILVSHKDRTQDVEAAIAELPDKLL